MERDQSPAADVEAKHALSNVEGSTKIEGRGLTAKNAKVTKIFCAKFFVVNSSYYSQK